MLVRWKQLVWSNFGWPHRLGRSRTPGFQPGNRGSNPLGAICVPAAYKPLRAYNPLELTDDGCLPLTPALSEIEGFSWDFSKLT